MEKKLPNNCLDPYQGSLNEEEHGLLPSTYTFRYLSRWDRTVAQPPVQVVSCFIQVKDKILILQRAKKDEQHLLWGIPGGKLGANELPVQGLAREIYEETRLKIDSSLFEFLGKAISQTSCDGVYGLYVYHTFLTKKAEISVTMQEHLAFRWVSIQDFEKTKLLTAQYEAYQLVKEKLEGKFRKKYEN